MINWGLIWAVLGMALAALMPGIGSAKGVGIAGQAGAAAIADKPELFGRVLVLQLLPGTQGIYGLLVAFIMMTNMGLLSGNIADISTTKGLAYLGACLPIACVGLWSAIAQGKASVASIQTVTRKPETFGRAMLFPAMVETYAILALLVSFLAIASVSGLTI